MPILEAMACGVPVVAFANTSIPETAGDAGVLVPDGDVDAFVDAVRRVLDDEVFATEHRLAGVEQAARFRWSAAADRYEEIFIEVGRR